MSYVIDRRLNGKNKSTVNRQRFLRRYREHIKKAVEEAVSRRSIMDMEHGEQISIPGRDIDEPVLHHGRGANRRSCILATKSSLPVNTSHGRKAVEAVAVAARPAIPARAWTSSSSRSPRKNFSNSCSKTLSYPTWSNVT